MKTNVVKPKRVRAPSAKKTRTAARLNAQIDPEDLTVIERLSTRLETSEYWQSRFAAFGLSADDLRHNDFKNKHLPRLLPKGYSNTWAA
jgi:hypothetical protein